MATKLLALVILVALLLAGAAGASGAAHAVGPLAPEIPGWQQVNLNGFGDPNAGEVSALEVFDGYLYAGTSNLIAGARIFRTGDGVTWEPVTEPGFGEPHDIRATAILDFAVFGGRLYASTGRSANAGQIWRSVNGTTWAPMVITGFSNPDTVDITVLAVYDEAIYAGATNRITGAQVWRSYTGDNNTWTQVAPAVPGTGPASVTGFAVFAGGLYATVEPEEGPAQIWRTYGGAWDRPVDDGFGNSQTTSTGGITGFAGYLYAGAGNKTAGAQLWRTQDEVAWKQAITAAFGDPNNVKGEGVFVFGNQLYASAQNAATGIELWRSTDGLAWKPANLDGFGDGHNTGTNSSNATAAFLNRLYVGTSNVLDGGEVWRMQQQLNRWVYLPLIMR